LRMVPLPLSSWSSSASGLCTGSSMICSIRYQMQSRYIRASPSAGQQCCSHAGPLSLGCTYIDLVSVSTVWLLTTPMRTASHPCCCAPTSASYMRSSSAAVSKSSFAPNPSNPTTLPTTCRCHHYCRGSHDTLPGCCTAELDD
jgi:hypothetical protein